MQDQEQEHRMPTYEMVQQWQNGCLQTHRAAPGSCACSSFTPRDSPGMTNVQDLEEQTLQTFQKEHNEGS